MKFPRALILNRATLLGMTVTLGILVYVRANTPRSMPLLHPNEASHASKEVAHPSALPAPQARRVYGHSIVPGGIHSVEELKRVIVSDPLAAQHYAGFDVSKAYITRFPHDELVFLSYRLNHKIYFTAILRLVKAGEEVLTDGNNYILTRCGNRIMSTYQVDVDVAQEPTDLGVVVAESPEPPPAQTASTPAATAQAGPGSPLAPVTVTIIPPAPSESLTSPFAVLPPVAGANPSPGSTPMQISGDDLDAHAEFTLLVCGLAAILAWRFLTR